MPDHFPDFTWVKVLGWSTPALVINGVPDRHGRIRVAVKGTGNLDEAQLWSVQAAECVETVGPEGQG